MYRMHPLTKAQRKARKAARVASLNAATVRNLRAN
jgi:hypothetical protein